MNPPRRNFVSRARSRGFTPGQARAWWREAAERARRLAASDQDPDLVMLVRRDGSFAARPAFPADGASAAHAAEALIQLAKAVGVVAPERRRAFLPALGAAAALVEALLAELQTADAKTWQGRMAPDLR